MDPIHILRRVFLRINSSGGYQTDEVQWYALNFSSNDDYDTQFYYDPERKKEKIERLLKPPTPIDPISTVSMPWLNSPCTTCGSTIYAIINDSVIHSVEADKISSAGRNWKLFSVLRDPAVQQERLVTEAVHLGNNIYLFGSSRDSEYDDVTVAEVFSLSHKRIVDTIHLSHPFYHEKLKFPPDNGFFAIADHSGQRIIVGSFYTGIIFFLMPGSPILHVLDASLPRSSGITFSRPVLFEETLYWIWINEGKGGMLAYDLSRRLCMSGPIIHLPDMFYVNSDFTPLLFHFCGDEFFLLWNDVADGALNILVRCVRLRVCKMEGDRLEAYTLSEKKHLLLHKKSALMDGVVLG